MSPSPRGKRMITIVSVLVGLSVISTFLRLIARVKRRAGFGVDDYLCVASTLLMLGMLVELILWCVIGGNGYHESTLDTTTLQTFYKIFLANQFTYFVLTPAVKISIVCFYRRIFTTPTFMRVTFWLNCLMAAWASAIFLACALQCRPLRAFWDKTVEGDCFDGRRYIIVNQSFNVVMEFIILGCPVPMIWSLHRSWREKLALNGVFALGGFVCFASIYRIVVLFYIDPTDTTWTIYEATLWTHVEPSVGLLVSCLPIIRGLFPRFWSMTSSQGTRIQLGPTGTDRSGRGDFGPSASSEGVWSVQESRELGNLKDITVQTEIELEYDSARVDVDTQPLNRHAPSSIQ
ncbi:uncharacterized protein ATNIH1004_003693 [Aspergillus tanneri]|uniref:Rhodopsin domain-containing protein n=1 Tax=Aspergillus tanneri TaxID=1220188 RepID=A0A5M9MV58_9EURO|nr:uncharacterized protein ATNIH1004_003693 [Aspergillus tanneri]KAA8651002.1 hypothetical protein ATNIH1004_003693 [Aspergillus tanneri]